jgi:hypothetical protein
MDFNAFHRAYNERLTFTACFELVATSIAPLSEAAPGFVRFHEEFMKRFGKGLTIYRTGSMMTWRKPTAKALQMAPHWLSEPRNLEGKELAMEFHSGPSQIEMMPPALRLYFQNGASYISALLPPEIATGGAEAVLDFMRTAIGDDFALAAGWGGYAILWNESMGPLFGDPQHQLGAWVRRHPGLGHGNNFAVYDRALHGIAHASWLTLLGPELVKRKGGAAAIATALGPDITVHALGGGVCIQAGPAPQLGDVNRGDNLPLYRRVGSFLKDVRTTAPPRALDGLEDDTEDWFARFDA